MPGFPEGSLKEDGKDGCADLVSVCRGCHAGAGEGDLLLLTASEDQGRVFRGTDFGETYLAFRIWDEEEGL